MPDKYGAMGARPRDIAIAALTSEQVRRVRLLAVQRVPKSEAAEVLAMLGIYEPIAVAVIDGAA